MRPGRAACALVVAVTMSAPAQDAFTELNGAQIKSVLSNKVVTDDQHWGHHYLSDGRVTRAEKGRVKPGRWTVENGQLCLMFPEISATQAECFHVYRHGNELQYRDQRGYAVWQGVVRKRSEARLFDGVTEH
jgi:hypothetical protein